MSLYIGNLSSHTHRGELERVFQRFGQCDICLKGRYGFVVYGSAPNAEKALIALQGRDICGESLTLMWSNKQPRPLKRFSNAPRSYKPPNGRNSARGGYYTNRKLCSNGLQDYNLGSKRLVRVGGQLISADMLDDATSYHQDRNKECIREEHCDYREDLLDAGGNVEPNQLDNDRWGGQLHDQPNGNTEENCMELDQYECYRGYDRKVEDENHQIAYSDGSHTSQGSQEIMWREHLSEVSLDPHNDSCYSCGGLGHKMRNCPRQNASKRKFMRFAHRHDDDINRGGRDEGKLERCGSDSQGKQQSNRDSLAVNGLGDDGKPYGSRRHQRFTMNTSSNEPKEANRARRKDNGRKRRRKMNFEYPNKHSDKKAKGSVSFPFHSDYTESRLHLISQSPKPVPKSCFRTRSRSVSSQLLSSTYDARSNSTTLRSRSTRTKSRSMSNSKKSMSFSVSVDRPLPSSSNMMQSNLNDTLADAAISESKEILVEQILLHDVALASVELESSMLVVKTENVVSSPKLDNDMEKNEPMQRDWNAKLMMCTSLHDIANPSTLSSEKGTLTSRSLSSETLKETREHRNSDASLMVHIPLPIKDSHSEVPVCFHSAYSASISSEEMHMVLKHYGQELPDENERSLPPETYFGSARLWPWEMIYYRRLKKGPISTENYARRVAQNQEFGIVDKYVRSSSGWGELIQDYR